jgi:hypothetical protein
MKETLLICLVCFALACGRRPARQQDDAATSDILITDLTHDRAADWPSRQDALAADLPAPIDAGSSADAAAPTADEVITACVLASSCFDGLEASINRCLDGFGELQTFPYSRGGWASRLVARRLLHCTRNALPISSAGACAKLQSCLGGRYRQPPSAVFEGARCSGNNIVASGYAAQKVLADCTTLDPKARCFELQTGAERAACALGSCKEGVITHCVDDATAQICPMGLPVAVSCDAFTARCEPALGVPLGRMAPPCQGRGDKCQKDEGVLRCEGERPVMCLSGRVAPFRGSCATNLFRSKCTTQFEGPCVARGRECSATQKSRCDNAQIVLCVDGFERTFDCRTLESSTCKQGGRGARCVP